MGKRIRNILLVRCDFRCVSLAGRSPATVAWCIGNVASRLPLPPLISTSNQCPLFSTPAAKYKGPDCVIA